MTRYEAIQFLDNMKHEEAGRAIGKDGFYAELISYHVQALNIAIKALEQQPCVGGDECKEVIKAYFDGQADTLEWIPIKTRPMTDEEKEHYRELGWADAFLGTIYDCNLPEDDQTVLITTKYGEVQMDTFYNEVDGALFETYSGDEDVLAWMPLPEPYKAEREEDNG